MMPVFSPVSCPPAPCCPSSFRCHAPASPGFFFPIRCYACLVLPVLSSMPHSGKFLIFLSYPMLCLPRVARPPFSVMLWQRRGNYTPYIVIARLRKAEYRLRQIPSSSLRTDGVGGGLAFGIPLSPIVIARLRKAEAIQYNLLNHYINVFIRNNCQTGLLRFARNDAGWVIAGLLCSQ